MTRKAPLPKITECFAPAPRSVSLSDSRISQALIAFLVLAALCVGHIYVRFTIRDMRVQQCKLELEFDQFMHEQTRLQSECQQLCESSRLRDVGRHQLGMLENDVRRQVIASVPQDLVAKYTEHPVRLPQPEIASSPELAGAPVKQILMSLVDVNKAYAAPEEQ